MDRDRWQRISRIYQAALGRRADERRGFLDEACAGDDGLAREVESLLAGAADAERFLITPALEVVGRALGPALALPPGARLGPYTILSLVGAGGMGQVYRAHDPSLDRDIALKVLPSTLGDDPEARARLVREARAAASLNHPGICTIHEVGAADGHTYIAMELVEGKPLSVRLAERPLPIDDVLRYGVQLAEAVGHAHDRGVVHRDLKSANVMVTPEGRLKVLDFGLAKRLTGDELAIATTRTQTSLTQPGTILGTLPYMAPEQLRGEPADARTDVWALGVVLYEMAAGGRPFTGHTGFELSSAIFHEPPPPLPSRVPAQLQAVTNRCLQKEPGRRYQRASELRAALEALAGATLTNKRPWQVRARSGRHRIAAAPAGRRRIAAVLLPLIVVAGIFASRPWRAPENAEPLRAVPLTTLPGVQRYPSFSPDGNHVAFTWTGAQQDNPDIYVQQIGSGAPLRLTTDPGNDYNVAWSPDGRWIAFLRRQSDAARSEVRLIPPLGGPERRLAEIRPQGALLRPVSIAWCPDSTCLVVTDSSGENMPDALFVVSLETGEKRQLTTPQPPALGDLDPAISPDGAWLVFRRQLGGLYIGELYAMALGSGPTAIGKPQQLTPATLDAEYAAWMPDSREILFSARGNLWRLGVPGDNTPARLPFVGEDSLMPAISRPQPGQPPRLVYVRSFRDSNIWRVESSPPGAPASSPPVLSIASTRGDTMPQLSPDGRRIAFTSTRSGGWEVWLADPNGANAVQLTSMGARAAGFPHWSPDGERIVFHSSIDGQWEIYEVSATGGKPRNLTAHSAMDSFPSFSSDGKWVYFNSNRTGRSLIWKVPVSGGNALQVTDGVGYAPIESPDGAFLYYVQTIDMPGPLWRVPISGGDPTRVLEDVVLTNFAVREGGIYYIDRPSREGTYYSDRPSSETRLQYFDFATRRSTTVARNLGAVDNPLTVSPDGRTIFYARVDSSVDDLMLVEQFR